MATVASTAAIRAAGQSNVNRNIVVSSESGVSFTSKEESDGIRRHFPETNSVPSAASWNNTLNEVSAWANNNNKNCIISMQSSTEKFPSAQLFSLPSSVDENGSVSFLRRTQLSASEPDPNHEKHQTNDGYKRQIDACTMRDMNQSKEQQETAASRSTIDAHANKLLRQNSPPESCTCIDDSLGPYITSILRDAVVPTQAQYGVQRADIRTLEQYDALVELVIEHCGMTSQLAVESLTQIFNMVISGKLPLVRGQRDRKNSEGSCPAVDELHAKTLKTSEEAAFLLRMDTICVRNEKTASRQGAGKFSDAPSPKDVKSNSTLDFDDNQDLRHLPSDLFVDDVAVRSDREEMTGFCGEGKLGSFNESHDLDAVAKGFSLALELGSVDVTKSEQKTSRTQISSTACRSSCYTTSCTVDARVCVKPFSSTRHEKQIMSQKTTKSNPAQPSITLQTITDNRFTKTDGISSCREITKDNDSNGAEKKEKSKKKNDNKGSIEKDLAAALFRPSRTRSNEKSVESSTLVNPNAAGYFPGGAQYHDGGVVGVPGGAEASDLHGYHDYSSAYGTEYTTEDIQAQAHVASVTDYILSFNPDLSPEAAMEAVLVASGDINVAQSLIEKAQSAPPVCRHMLSHTCYRSDCQFSHDLEGHTCSFWLRGRCGKGPDCRFLHGFHQKGLDGTVGATASENMLASGMMNMSLSETANPDYTGSGVRYGAVGEVVDPVRSNWGWQPSSDTTSGQVWSGKSTGTSFASVASSAPPRSSTLNKSYAGRVGSSNAALSRPAQTAWKTPSNNRRFVKIPQELWNASHNRDPQAFYIVDPVERYYAVNANVSPTSRHLTNVMDLHFQSVKTAPAVLAAVLPDKLQEMEMKKIGNDILSEKGSPAGVWIVTGSGHHVDTRSHQKSGGILEACVTEWLDSSGYEYFRGKDRNGHSGAILVVGWGQSQVQTSLR